MTTETIEEVTNAERRERGAQVVADYCERNGGDDHHDSGIRDVLTDLMHTYGYAAFESALGTARHHYAQESDAPRFEPVEGDSAMVCPGCGQENDVWLRSANVERADYIGEEGGQLQFEIESSSDDSTAEALVCVGCGFEDSSDRYGFDIV